MLTATVTRGFLPTRQARKGDDHTGASGVCVHMHYNWVHGGSCIECVGVPTRDFTDTNNYLFKNRETTDERDDRVRENAARARAHRRTVQRVHRESTLSIEKERESGVFHRPIVLRAIYTFVPSGSFLRTRRGRAGLIVGNTLHRLCSPYNAPRSGSSRGAGGGLRVNRVLIDEYVLPRRLRRFARP